MDGKGRYNHNIFVEQLWRTVKHEEVYLKAYTGRTGGPRPGSTLTSASTTPSGPIRPWATGHQPRCSIKFQHYQRKNQQRRGGHQAERWYTMRERRDPRLISGQSCPTNWVHLRPCAPGRWYRPGRWPRS